MPPIDHFSYSFADLSAAAISLRPVEAVTIVRELALRVERGELRGVPSAHVIRLSASGMVSVGGPMAADSRSVARAAHLLDTLLPPINDPARVPGALRLVLARALGTLDLPPYPSLDSFAQALSRFASDDLEGTVRALVARQPAPADPPRARRLSDATPAEVYDLAVREGTGTARGAQTRPERSPLTISDIRRARRATGLTLAEISERSHISIRLLRELEWGYLRNWPGSDVGRHQLVRYAHAAGLDDQTGRANRVAVAPDVGARARSRLGRDDPVRADRGDSAEHGASCASHRPPGTAGRRRVTGSSPRSRFPPC